MAPKNLRKPVLHCVNFIIFYIPQEFCFYVMVPQEKFPGSSLGCHGISNWGPKDGIWAYSLNNFRLTYIHTVWYELVGRCLLVFVHGVDEDGAHGRIFLENSLENTSIEVQDSWSGYEEVQPWMGNIPKALSAQLQLSPVYSVKEICVGNVVGEHKTRKELQPFQQWIHSLPNMFNF